MAVFWRAIPLLTLLVVLCGCFPTPFPSQSKPTCSWTTQIPRNAGSLCSMTFQTVQAIVRAEAKGDDGTIRKIVVARQVANRIIAHGRTLRAEQARSLHAVPSLTLEEPKPGMIGAAFYLTARTAHGNFSGLEQIYLRVEGKREVVVQDQPEQEW